MKAVLEFDLPEEHSEHQAAINGELYSTILFNISQYCRNILKYGLDEKDLVIDITASAVVENDPVYNVKYAKLEEILTEIRAMIPPLD